MLAWEPGVRPVDWLTDEDQRMLWPDEFWPQEIGALAVLDGGALAGPCILGWKQDATSL